MRKFLLLCFAALCLACGQTVRIGQLVFNNTITRAYLDNAPFDGEAWSDDGKTICLTCEKGKVTAVKVFHDNGQVAIDGTSFVDASQVYDDKGNPISAETLKKNYPQITCAITNMIAKMYCDVHLK